MNEMTPGGDRPPRGRPRWIVVSAGGAVVAVVVLLVVLLAQDDPTRRVASSEEPAEGELPPPPAERGPTVSWLQANDAAVNAFADIMTAPTTRRPDECEETARRLTAAVGPIEDFLRTAETSPDPVLVELLQNNAQAARVLLEACRAGDRELVAEERENLENGLELVEARRRQLGQP